MEHQSPKILLVHNRFSWKSPLTWLSLIIRVVTSSKWNHAAILKDGEVWEAVGKGIIHTHVDKWTNKANRIVCVMNPLVPVNIQLQSGPYGFLDLLQFLLHIIRTKWFLIGHSWDGEDGTKIWKGTFCSELVGLSLGRKDAHLLAPADLYYLPELEYSYEFKTFGTTKKINNV